MPNGTETCAPIIIGETNSSRSKAKYTRGYTPMPITRENPIKCKRSFFSGNLNLKKGRKAKKIKPTLKDENNNGGILLFIPILPTG